jgi:hypothetical protein
MRQLCIGTKETKDKDNQSKDNFKFQATVIVLIKPKINRPQAAAVCFLFLTWIVHSTCIFLRNSDEYHQK